MRAVIVSRHPGAILWLRREIAKRLPAWMEVDNIPVVAEATPEDVKGRWVYGNLPFHLAAEADVVSAIEFDVPPRGGDYTPSEMQAAGAHLRDYVVYLHRASSSRAEEDLAETFGELQDSYRDLKESYVTLLAAARKSIETGDLSHLETYRVEDRGWEAQGDGMRDKPCRYL